MGHRGTYFCAAARRELTRGEVVRLLRVDEVINAVEWVMKDYAQRSASKDLLSLEGKCIELSRLESIIPGAYLAARLTFEGIQAARVHSGAVAQEKMTEALRLLKSLPNENWCGYA